MRTSRSVAVHSLLLVGFLLLLASRAAAAADTHGERIAKRWDALIERKEFFALRAEVDGTHGGLDRDYFLGVVAAKFNRLDEARSRLEAFLAEGRTDRARAARECLVEVEKRSQDYAAAARDLERILRDFGARLTAAERDDDGASARYLGALGREPRMRLAPGSPDTIDFAIVKPGGIVGGVGIGGHRVAFGFDSGANFSICGDSTATLLGLRPVVRDVPLGTINDRGLTAEFRIADRVEIGGATLVDVPFLVIPESMMRLSGGAGLIGFPVALAARRLVMRYGARASGAGAGPAPFAIDGLNPITQATCAEIDAVLAIDTGASRTILYPGFYRRARSRRVKFGAAESSTSTGLGGSSMLQMRRLDRADLRIGGFVVRLEHIPTWVTPRTDASRVLGGNLGNDVFRAMGTVVFDFERMTFGAL